jgi:hypothetical protein
MAPARATVRPTSARWAWVEYVLAQGGMDAGRRALSAYRGGGGFAAWRRAFSDYKTRHEQEKLRQCRSGLSIYSEAS